MMNIDKLYEKKGGQGTTFKVIERDADNYPSMCYFNLKMPMFMADRDSCFSFTRQVKDNGTQVYISQTCDHPDYPVR